MEVNNLRKFLSIVIQRYKETEREIFPLLSSINTQVGVDFSDIEVIIATDGKENGTLDNDFLKLFGFDIRQTTLEKNSGPGVARQAGLHIAKGEYVMFCDADDTLHNVGVLGALMKEAEISATDMLSSSWIEEIVNENDEYVYITHEQENTWMHGKLLRRQFLLQNNIQFHDDLRVHEDSYFLCITASLAEKNRFLPITSYVWKYHPNSITRRNGSIYSYESIPEFIKACSLAHSVVEQHVPAQMEYKILQFTLYNYFCFHQSGWQAEENKEYLEKAEKAFCEYINPFWHYWKNADKQTIANVYNQERQRSFNGHIETETVYEWIKRLGL